MTVSGVSDGTAVCVYSVSGQMLASTKGSGNKASLSTNLRRGETVIVKIGGKSVKTVMQ